MKFKCGFISFALFFLMLTNVHAQVMEVGINAGVAGYMGDLNPDNPFDIGGPALGAYVKANLDPYWAIGLHYNHGKLKYNDANSSDADFRGRNLNFSTPVNELSMQVDFNFLDYFSGGGTRHFSPFVFAGLGGVLFNPKATYQGQEYQLKEYQTEGKNYKNYALSIPFGAGVKVRISDNLAILSQLGYRTVYSDYLDDVGDKYPLLDVFGKIDQAQPLWINLSNPSQLPHNLVPGGQRGDYRKHDTCFFFQLGISFTFLSDKCFSF